MYSEPGYVPQFDRVERSLLVSTSTLLRSSGLALIAGSVLGVLSSLAASTGSPIFILALLFDSLGWLMLAAGLLVLGIYLLRQSNEENRLSRLLAVLGAGAAAVSVLR